MTGIGNGLNTSTCPVWQSETSKAKSRGKLVIWQLIFNIGGFSLSNWMTYGLSFVKDSSVQWRFPLAFQLLFAFILFGTVPFLPESPRWLLKRGREEEAIHVLCALHGSEFTPGNLPAEVQEQHDDILETIETERAHAKSWRQLVRKEVGGPANLRRIILGAGTQAMQQFSGINVVSYYFPLVLQNSVGFSEPMPRLLAACNSVSYLFFSAVPLWFIDRWGRRPLMLWGAGVQGVCYLVITVVLSIAATSEQYQMGAIATAFFFIYFATFGVAWLGSTPPLQLRY